jgi:O-antigen/teichoic acid export membrane protein
MGHSIVDFFNYNLYFSISSLFLVAIQRLFLYPFIANKIGAENFGSFVLFMSIVNIAIVVIPGCINMVILRIHASFEESEKDNLFKVGILLILVISIITSLLIFFIFPEIAYFFKIGTIYKSFIIPLVIFIIFYGVREGLLIKKRVELKFGEISIYNIIFALLFFIMIPLYSFFEEKGIFWGYVIVSMIATIIIIPHTIEIFKGRVEKKYLKDFYKFSPSFAFVSVMELSILASSRYVISYYKDPIYVAYFFAAVSIVQMLSFPFAQIRTVLLSFISQKGKIEDFSPKDVTKIVSFSLIVGIILFIIGFIFSKLIIGGLYGVVYYENSKVALIILLVGQIFYIMKMYLNNFIILFFDRKILNWNSFIMFLINITINVIFVPRYGINASAAAFTFSFFVSALWWYLALMKKMQKKKI